MNALEASSRDAVTAPQRSSLGRLFSRLSRGAGRFVGHPAAFAIAAASVLAWAFTAPLFDDKDTWQLVINTATTIITFLMVFLLQAGQNRDAEAIQLKLDELIRAVAGARNSMVSIEQLDLADLDRLQKTFDELAARARARDETASDEPAPADRIPVAEREGKPPA